MFLYCNNQWQCISSVSYNFKCACRYWNVYTEFRLALFITPKYMNMGRDLNLMV